MVRALHVALVLVGAAVLLVAATGGAGATGDAGAAPAAENPGAAPAAENVSLSTPMAPSPNESTTGVGTVSADLGAVLDTEFERVRTRNHQLVLDERLAGAGDDTERRGLLRDEVSRLDERITSLREAEAAVVESYHAGEIDEEEALLRLARIHATASATDGSVRHVQARADEVPQTASDQELARLSTDTATLQGPLRERVAADVRGLDRAESVRVTATEDSVSLAGVYDGSYEREAVRQRPLAEGEPLDLVEAWDEIQGQYPWIARFSDTQTSWAIEESGLGFGSPAYRADVVHPLGSLEVYVDSVSGTAFVERQQNPVGGMTATTRAANVTDGDLRVLVDRTYPTGPARVTVEDADTGEPLAGDVTVDGTNVGRTGDDGTLWYAAPVDESDVTVRVDSDAVTVPVRYADG